MTSAWIVYVLLVGALLALAAAGVESAFRLAGRPARLVWAVALVLSVALAVIAPFRSGPAGPQPLAIPTVVTTGPEPTAAPFSAFGMLLRAWGDARDLVTRPIERTLARTAVRLPARAGRWLAAAWALLSAALLALLVAVQLRYRRARRGWPVVALHGARVRVAPDAGPAVVGLTRPEIVVPAWLLRRDPDEQRLVLAHEQEHLRARDPLLLAAGCTAVALLPWHPLAWWMLSRLRLAVELDCDARVLRRGATPHRYGALLIDLAGRCAGLPLGAAALAEHRTHLERRLLAMRPTAPLFARAQAVSLGALALALVVAACESTLPTASQVANLDVSTAEQGARRLTAHTPGDSLATYTVDGRRVAAAAARALKPEEIASIEVTKHGPDDHGTIAIVTRQAAGPRGAVGHVDRVADRVRGANGGKFDGVVLIDGRRRDEAAMQALAPSTIVSVEVIKGPAAAKLYDAPEAANGVIRITTKAGGGASR